MSSVTTDRTGRRSAPGMVTSPDGKPHGTHPCGVAVSRDRSRRRVHIVSLAAFLILILAWVYGHIRTSGEILPRVGNVLPGATRIETRGSVFAGYGEGSQLIGYAGVSEAVGYAGPIQMLVGINPQGEVIGVEVVEHRETPGFFELLRDDSFLPQFLGKRYSDRLRLGEDLDAVSGATISSEAVARAVREQVRALGSGPIGAQVPVDSEALQFGAPEVLLIGLYVVGYFGHRSRHQQAKKWFRRATLVVGAVGLGFIYNKPLSLANFISLISGYWPDWHTNVYWFLLLGGILFVTTAQGKNPYCSWFCPFGAVQEGLGRIGGAKLYRPRRWHSRLLWAQRGLAFGAITLGLALRQPGPASFEPFGTLFDFTGNLPQWILLALILLASLLIYRPFCNYLCPMYPIVDYIGDGRRMLQRLAQRFRR